MALIYTDYLGNPVRVGDTIVYPYASGSSSAGLHTGVIEEIDDIIPEDANDPYCRVGQLHKDRNKQYPPRRDIACGEWDPDAPHPVRHLGTQRTGRYRRDDSKAYMVRISKPGGPRVTLKNVDRIVVVSSLVH